MPAGSLNKRVAFQQRIDAPDGGGGKTSSWQTVLTVWGGFRPQRGRERLEAGRLSSAVAGVLTVRSSNDTRQITEVHRVMIDNVPYQVQAIINPDQRYKYLEMTVERGVPT